MNSIAVNLDIAPGSGQLDCWGADPAAWAPIVWMERVMPPGAIAGVHRLTCAGVDAREARAAIRRRTGLRRTAM